MFQILSAYAETDFSTSDVPKPPDHASDTPPFKESTSSHAFPSEAPPPYDPASSAPPQSTIFYSDTSFQSYANYTQPRYQPQYHTRTQIQVHSPPNTVQPAYYVHTSPGGTNPDPRYPSQNILYVHSAPQVIVPLPNPPPDYLVHSVLTIVFCCWFLGFIAMMKSFRVRSAVQCGDRRLAVYESMEARKWNIAALSVGTVMWVTAVVLIAIICI
jgi:hypothetical protein